MNGDEITDRVDFLNFFRMDDHGGKVPGMADRQIGVKAVNFHPQGDCRVGDQDADGTQSDDAQGFSLEFCAGKGFLGLLGGFGDVFIFRVLPDPGDAAGNVTGSQEHAAEHQFLDGVCVGTGSVEDHNAFFRAAVQRDIVDAGARAGNRPETGGEGHFLHIGGADQHAGSLVDGISQRITGTETVCPNLRNIIQAKDFTVFHKSSAPFLISVSNRSTKEQGGQGKGRKRTVLTNTPGGYKMMIPGGGI